MSKCKDEIQSKENKEIAIDHEKLNELKQRHAEEMNMLIEPYTENHKKKRALKKLNVQIHID